MRTSINALLSIGSARIPVGWAAPGQLQGKELGFNNIQDAAAAFQLVSDYDEPAAAIIKHMNPCGLADRRRAVTRLRACI